MKNVDTLCIYKLFIQVYEKALKMHIESPLSLIQRVCIMKFINII